MECHDRIADPVSARRLAPRSASPAVRLPAAERAPVQGFASGACAWRVAIVTLALAVSLTHGGARAVDVAAEAPNVNPELRRQAIEVLRGVFDHEAHWIKVHAAESLLALDYPQGVEEAFAEQLRLHETEPEYRIGIWRVLARATHDPKERCRWVHRIRDIFLDPTAPDRLHAVETLAKLGYTIPVATGSNQAVAERAALEGAAASDGPEAPFARWILLDSDPQRGDAPLAELLGADAARTRGLAAYAIRHLTHVSAATRKALVSAATAEPLDSTAWIHLACAVAVHGTPEDRVAYKQRLHGVAEAGSADAVVQACQTLAQVADHTDLPLLARLLARPEADIRAAAAHAILRTDRRAPHFLTGLDWFVIGFYAAGMLVVGWYYSRKTTTTEDYLLGSRNMKSFGVGLSLFATLMSTISYLAYPGEMIRFGPMVFSMILAYPFVALVVGWLMIPFIMKLRVTSAYQILEIRLGLGVRMLGALFFLSLRLLWMAVIIYATIDKVLVPLLGLDRSATPYLCAVLGLITVTYTAMGGLRAVVLTDVIQTVILLAGALLTLIVVTIHLGGVGNWWPAGWPSHWPEPQLYNPKERITLFGFALANFTWWICTAGSDQMAIQRYLATRDVKAARNVLIVTLAANVLVNLLLAPVGLALLAYFRLNPHLIPDGQTILGDADRLFPQFIAIGLPAGLSGLVVAGLLAAAMSSLSSGVNSSCSVITVDFIDRFRRSQKSELDHVRLAKYVSVLVGVVVVFLSAYVGVIQGNLLEVTYKLVNSLAPPLFGLFFMAMFVPWAKGWATILGAVCGVFVVVTVSFWKEITGSTEGISFIWAMPLSFVVQTAIGALASLLPIGRAAAPLQE